jgi:hypothetical protein
MKIYHDETSTFHRTNATMDMEGLMITLNHIARWYRAENDKWWRDPLTGEKLVPNRDQKLLLIVGEIIEAHEGLRKDTMDKHLPHRKTECVELADAFIRLMDYIGEFHPDFGEAVVEKLEYNRTREDHTAAARLAPGGKKF